MADFEARVERSLRKNFPIYEYMDFKVESASGGVYRAAVPLNEENSNHFDTVHAALQWASLEALGGLVWIAVKPEDRSLLPVVKRFEIDFKRPATTDITAETKFSESEAAAMRAALAADGRCDFELESTIRNTAGEVVAEGKGFYSVRKASAITGAWRSAPTTRDPAS
ncbi:MAG: YiiD C-terminal domain-containing protein [Myxococcota bacterium]|jgi:acyl-coenzyme A thioesterase PaaI-like protein|nr:YiiD C-terminal domain-containing protein [Myxococcota bacterium]